MKPSSMTDTAPANPPDMHSDRPAMALNSILVVEDDEGLADLFQQTLAELNLPIQWVRTGKEAIAALTANPGSLVLLDYALPDMNAATMVETLALSGPVPPFIVITGRGDEQVAVKLMKLGARDYLIKDTQLLDRLSIVASRAIRDFKTLEDLRESERKRLQNERELAIIYDHIPTPILVMDQEFRLVKVNAAAASLIGESSETLQSHSPGYLLDCARVTQPRGCGSSSRCPDCTLRNCVLDTLLTGQPHRQLEVKIARMKSGKESTGFFLVSTVRLEIEGRPVALACMEDITERKHAEAQLLRSQRMESIGRLSSGIAHDLNNVLAPILMVMPLLREEASNEEAKNYIDTVEASAKRGASIVKQVLTFGRGVDSEPGPIQLRHLIKEMAQIIRETFPKSVTLECRCPSDLWVIIGDATQLHQVLMNLCINARDAMPDGGVITVSAANIQFDKPRDGMFGQVQPGPYIQITVADTGTGISPENLDKIFDPFFTTKAADKGTGLGLSSVLGIVKRHAGAINVTSAPGHGAVFEVFLPATLETESASPIGIEPPAFLQGRGQTILLVDDEVSIREITNEVLTKNGYKVMTACDGAEGLALFKKHRESISLILTDFVMPKMDGLALALEARKINPAVKIMLSTGVSERLDESRMSNTKSGEVAPILIKPFSAQTLLTQVRDQLGR